MKDQSLSHEHDYVGEMPERLPLVEIRELSKDNRMIPIRDIVWEWGLISGTIAIWFYFNNLFLYPLVLLIIGSRQHALSILGHDAAHYILFKNKKINDWVGNLLLFWPTFASVEGFRNFHGDHHRYLNQKGDGNRKLWNTHTIDGELTQEWTYPKTLGALLLKLFKKSFFLTGIIWIIRGAILSPLFVPEHRRNSWWYVVARFSYYSFFIYIFFYFGYLIEFLLLWIVPFCTWYIGSNYIRLICEHSAIPITKEPYHMTRSTLPSLLQRIFVLPRNIGYHHEHHFYPSVPYFQLPELHKRLVNKTTFGKYAIISNSVLDSLRDCIASNRENNQ